MPKQKKKDEEPYFSDMINLEIQKAKLNVEKSTLIFNKGILLYFSFLFVGVLGFIQGYINQFSLNIIIIMGMVALIIGAIPYLLTTKREERKFNDLLDLLRSKKGLSPLIATVLLIAFAVALGAVVMNWGRAQLSTNSCSKVNLDFERVNDIPQICREAGGSLDILVTNKGNVPITEMLVTVIGGAGEQSKTFTQALNAADTQQLTVDAPQSIGFLRMIKIVPGIGQGDSKSFCTDQDVKVLFSDNNVPNCQ